MTTHEQRIADWLRATADANHLSFEAWAMKAETSGTNITRFLKHGRPIPKLATLLRLAHAIGTVPPELVKPVGLNVALVPIVKSSWVRDDGWRRARDRATERIAVIPTADGACAFRVTNDLASSWHIVAGDIVVVRPEETPADGVVIVVATLGDDIDIMRYAPPLLIPPALGALPQRVGERMILGTVVQIIRVLPG